MPPRSATFSSSHDHHNAHRHHSTPMAHHGGTAPVAPVSPAAAKAMQIIGALLLPIGAILFIIGLVSFFKIMFSGPDFDPFDFNAMIAAQISAMGFLFAGMPLIFVGLVFLLIGKTRRSLSAGAAASFPSTIQSPVGTQDAQSGNAFQNTPATGVPAIAAPTSKSAPASKKFCSYCGAPNDGTAIRCSNCSAQL